VNTVMNIQVPEHEGIVAIILVPMFQEWSLLTLMQQEYNLHFRLLKIFLFNDEASLSRNENIWVIMQL
jgi:hypothetical protein